MSYSALGDTVNVASRLQAAAEPGSVCITRATLDLVEGFVDATPLGARQFKGKAQPIEVYRLDALRSGVTRFGAKRRHGLDALARPRRRARAPARALERGEGGPLPARQRDRRRRARQVAADLRVHRVVARSARAAAGSDLPARGRRHAVPAADRGDAELVRHPDEGASRDLVEAKLKEGLERLKIDQRREPALSAQSRDRRRFRRRARRLPASELTGLRIARGAPRVHLPPLRARLAGGDGGRGSALDRFGLARRARRHREERERRAAALAVQLPAAVPADLGACRRRRPSSA